MKSIFIYEPAITSLCKKFVHFKEDGTQKCYRVDHILYSCLDYKGIQERLKEHIRKDMNYPKDEELTIHTIKNSPLNIRDITSKEANCNCFQGQAFKVVNVSEDCFDPTVINALKQTKRYEILEYSKLSRYQKVVNFIRKLLRQPYKIEELETICQFMAIKVDNEDIQAKIKKMNEDLKLLTEKGLVLGALTMPFIMETTNTNKNEPRGILACYFHTDYKRVKELPKYTDLLVDEGEVKGPDDNDKNMEIITL